MNSSSGEVWDTFLFTPFFYNGFTLADSPIWYSANGEPNFWIRQSWLHQLEQELSLLFYLHIPSSSLSLHIYMDNRLPTLMLIVSNCPSIITLRAGPPSIHMLWLRQMSLHIMTIRLIYKHTLWPSPNNTHRQGESNSRLLQHQPCQSIKRQQLEQNLLDIILCQWISDW